jgi:hypothetical protein
MNLAETVRKWRRASQERKAKRNRRYVEKRSHPTQPGRQYSRPEDGGGGSA